MKGSRGTQPHTKSDNLVSLQKISWKVLTKDVAENLNRDFNTIYVFYKTCSKVTSVTVNSVWELNYTNRSLGNAIELLV